MKDIKRTLRNGNNRKRKVHSYITNKHRGDSMENVRKRIFEQIKAKFDEKKLNRDTEDLLERKIRRQIERYAKV